MAKHDQVKPAPQKKQSTPEPVQKAEDRQALKDELDELLDEIDEVLEENAQQFVQEYVQKGGQ